MDRRSKLIYWIALGSACAVGFLLRYLRLAEESFSFDEIIQIQNSNLPLGQFLEQRWLQIDPPLNDVIAYIWQSFLHAVAPSREADELFVRIPVCLFGVLTIPAAAAAAKLAFGSTAGAIAAWLTAVNPYHIRYSQEARMYALVVLLASLAMYYLIKTLRPQARARDAVFLMLYLVLLFLTHYIALLALGAIVFVASILYFRGRKEPGRPAKYSFYGSDGALLLAIVLLLPHAYRYISGTGARSNREWIAQAGSPTFADLLDFVRHFAVDSLDVAALWNGGATAVEYAGAAALAFFVIFIIWGGVRGLSEQEPPGLRAILIVIVASAPLILFCISQLQPVFVHRYLLFIFPPAILLAARSRSVVLAVIICSIMIALAPAGIELRKKSPFREAAAAFVKNSRLRDHLVLTNASDVPFKYYVSKFAGLRSPAGVVLQKSTHVVTFWNATEMMSSLGLEKSKDGNIYILENRELTPHVELWRQPAPAHWTEVFSVSQPHLRLWRFERERK